MGNCCGKSTTDDAFSSQGRTLGSAPAPSSGTAPIPNRASKPPPRVGGPAHVLGSGATETGDSDPRSAAAKAAEARASKLQGGQQGKLAQNLAAQKRQTAKETLEQASREQRGARDQDQAAEVRAYN